MFNHICKHLKVGEKYCATPRIFNSLFGVWKCGQMRSFVFDILLHILTFPGRESITGPMYLFIHSLSRFLFAKELSL